MTPRALGDNAKSPSLASAHSARSKTCLALQEAHLSSQAFVARDPLSGLADMADDDLGTLMAHLASNARNAWGDYAKSYQGDPDQSRRPSLKILDWPSPRWGGLTPAAQAYQPALVIQVGDFKMALWLIDGASVTEAKAALASAAPIPLPTRAATQPAKSLDHAGSGPA